MRALNEADVGKKTDAEDEQESAERERAARDKPAAPRGLGIRDRLQRAERDDEPDETPSSTPAPVPAQPQTHVTSADVEILALARTIVEAPVSTRRDVLASACRTLARGRSQEEAIRLAEELDATIKRLDGVPRTALDRVRARMK